MTPPLLLFIAFVYLLTFSSYITFIYLGYFQFITAISFLLTYLFIKIALKLSTFILTLFPALLVFTECILRFFFTVICILNYFHLSTLLLHQFYLIMILLVDYGYFSLTHLLRIGSHSRLFKLQRKTHRTHITYIIYLLCSYCVILMTKRSFAHNWSFFAQVNCAIVRQHVCAEVR